MRVGIISAPPSVINCPHPICATCLYDKSKRHSHKADTGNIAQSHTNPGAGVSADQFEAGCPGIIPTNKGSLMKLKYGYCNFWVDHGTKFIYVTMHPTKEAKEMLISKAEFEAFSSLHGVSIHSYRGDNGVYSSAPFRASCTQQTQQLSLCTVGSHWQNGIAEQAISYIQSIARDNIAACYGTLAHHGNRSLLALCYQTCCNTIQYRPKK
jgi:hypothetical protein